MKLINLLINVIQRDKVSYRVDVQLSINLSHIFNKSQSKVSLGSLKHDERRQMNEDRWTKKKATSIKLSISDVNREN